MVPALRVEDIVDEPALARVRSQDGDLVRGIVEQPHVHEQRDCVLGLAQVDQPVRRGLGLAAALVVRHVDELVLVLEACVGDLELRARDDAGQVREGWVSPFVQFGDGGAGAALLVEHYCGSAEADEALEEGLFQVCVLSESEVLDDGRVLEVVTAENDALERELAVSWVLEGERNEVLNFSDLSCFLHDNIVVMESKGCNLLSSHRSMCRCHGDDAGLLHKQIVCLVARVSQDLERTDVLELREDLLNMTVATLSNLEELLTICFGWEQGLWCVREIVFEGKLSSYLLDTGLF
jgi:hypothetical protein